MDSVFLWAQVIGFIGMFFNIMAWQMKNSRYILLVNAPAGIIWSVHYLMLGSPVGAMLNLCSGAKDGALYHIEDRHVPYVIGIFLTVIWGTGLYYYAHWYDPFTLIAATILNVSFLWRDNRAIVARASVAACIPWLVFNVMVDSWMGVSCLIMMMTSSIIGMYRHEKWEIGRCYKSFLPSLAKSLFISPNFKTYP